MIRLLAVCLLFVGSALTHVPVLATPSASEDLSAFKELQQSKWEAQKDLQQKDTETLRQQIAAVDKRVDDQLTQVGQGVDRFGVLISVLGVVVTVLLVFGGFLGYRNAKAEATAEAKDAATAEAKKTATIEAQSSAEEWFKSKAMTLTEQIAELERKAAHAQVQINARVQGLVAHAETTTAEIDAAKTKTHAALQLAQEYIEDRHLKSSPAQEEAKRTLAERDQELKATNEDSYSFDDWNTRAHAAYSASKLDDAAYFWLKAAGVKNAGAANVARVMLNRGVTQRQLNEPEAAINTYDEVLRRFGDAAEPALQEQVAAALFNKGNAQVGIEQYEAAISAYDEVMRRFGHTTEPALREPLAKAMNGAGFARLMQAKTLGPSTPAGQDILLIALKNLNDAVAKFDTPNGLIVGNRSYVRCLLGQLPQAEIDFAMALRAPVNGGKDLYEATLKDLNICRVNEDSTMQAMVEREWGNYLGEVTQTYKK